MSLSPVSTHKDTHHAAVITATGQHLGAAEFPTTTAGYQALAAFIAGFGTLAEVGVEGSGSYGAGLTRYLTSAGVRVIEVLRPSRQVRRMRGKSDEIDAYAAAQTALAGRNCSVPKNRDGRVEAIRVVATARRSAVAATTDAMLQIRDILVTAPEAIRGKYRGVRGKPLIAALAKIRLHEPNDVIGEHTLTALRALARRVQQLRTEIDAHDQTLAGLVARVNPALIQTKGVGVVSAAALLIAAGDNPDRITGEAAFAALCGACPVPASSGKITRHRLNRGGNRNANCALHRIAVVRLHTDQRTRDYAASRRAAGKTSKEILRCLKRAIAREVYHLLTNPPEQVSTTQLRPMRQAAGLTIETTAHDLHWSMATVSHIERGHTSNRAAIITYRNYLTSQQPAGCAIQEHPSFVKSHVTLVLCVAQG